MIQSFLVTDLEQCVSKIYLLLSPTHPKWRPSGRRMECSLFLFLSSRLWSMNLQVHQFSFQPTSPCRWYQHFSFILQPQKSTSSSNDSRQNLNISFQTRLSLLRHKNNHDSFSKKILTSYSLPSFVPSELQMNLQPSSKFLCLIFVSKTSWIRHIKILRSKCLNSLNILRLQPQTSSSLQ